MKRTHMPRIEGRYWVAITLASIFGTNLGDLYAHESGFGLMQGAGVLLLLSLIVFAVERADRRTHQIYYWLVIVIIRTGATNIGDYLAYAVRIPGIPLILGLSALIAVLAFTAGGTDKTGDKSVTDSIPATGAVYWFTMLVAGVFGTVFGDVASQMMGQGVASIVIGFVLALVLAFVLWVGSSKAATAIGIYWFTIAIVRTAGTTMGDWLAENKILHIGLPASTVITGLVFVTVLLVWRSRLAATRDRLAPQGR